MAKSMTDDVNDRYLRPQLTELLSQCTEKQQAFFVRLWGEATTMNPGNIPRAIEQCEATIKKNTKGTP